MRLATISAPRFLPCAGLTISKAWGEVALASLNEEQAAAVVTTGLIIRAHPGDLAELDAWLEERGLELHNGRTHRGALDPPPPPAPPAGEGEATPSAKAAARTATTTARGEDLAAAGDGADATENSSAAPAARAQARARRRG